MPVGQLPNTSCTTGADCASGICSEQMCVIPEGAAGEIEEDDCHPGSLGCACERMTKCKAGLACMDGLCCNAESGRCDSGPAPTPPSSTGGSSTPSACTPGVVGPVITECGYPYESSNPLTDILFNESSVLAAIVPSGGYPLASIQLFYNDEHAMTLGVRQTVINGVTTDFPVSPMSGNPASMSMPETGTNAILGELAGVDPVGRPMWPALFITDITEDAASVSGDWQWGGTPISPTYIAGTWKGAVRTVDADGATITPDPNPEKNNQDYGNGHAAPDGAIVKPEGYGTEVRWDIRLEPGRNYRFQVMVHDGDQNKIGGDSGEACVTFCAGNACAEGLEPCDADGACVEGDVCLSGCCITPPSAPPSDAGVPPPTNGHCPPGYVLTLRDGEQVCSLILIN